jgi:hypothetical protein
MINEMERFLNQEISKLAQELTGCLLHNEYKGVGVSRAKKEQREKFQTDVSNINNVAHMLTTLLCNIKYSDRA